ncbi:hypothetical protein BaRGS_00001958 [Batillaria attramentaria]|uniref:Uncharacterized protein n=1 Tax=Batillaria attramentaria TaxID=370345 RepID=A0ABD0M640_9CAEN
MTYRKLVYQSQSKFALNPVSALKTFPVFEITQSVCRAASKEVVIFLPPSQWFRRRTAPWSGSKSCLGFPGSNTPLLSPQTDVMARPVTFLEKKRSMTGILSRLPIQLGQTNSDRGSV